MGIKNYQLIKDFTEYYSSCSMMFPEIYIARKFFDLFVMLVTPSGGGGSEVERGAAPALRISRKKGVFCKTSACPRFVREGYFLYPGTKYER